MTQSSTVHWNDFDWILSKPQGHFFPALIYIYTTVTHSSFLELTTLMCYKNNNMEIFWGAQMNYPPSSPPSSFILHIQGVLCLRCFLRLWKNNRVSRKLCKWRSDLVLNGQMRSIIIRRAFV